MCPKSSSNVLTTPAPNSLTKMTCNCSCNDCNFFEAGNKLNVTLSSDSPGLPEFCPKDTWTPKYQLACRSYVDDLVHKSGAENASSNIIVVLCILCLVLLLVIFLLIIKRTNDAKEIASLKDSLDKKNEAKTSKVEI